MRVVFDTNVWISTTFWRESVPAQATQLARRRDKILMTFETLDEMGVVLKRPRFDRYLDLADRLDFLAKLSKDVIMIGTFEPIRACRDPKDDKFLEAAVWGNADCIITGDEDLLILHPFRGIRICTPADFLLDA